jgi:hypothetical protein
MSDLNKNIVAKYKEILKELGYDVKTSHIYHLLSKVAGERNWNTAKARGADFVKSVNSLYHVSLDSKKFNFNEYKKLIESGKLLNKVCYGISEIDKDFQTVDPVDQPGSIMVGGMGSGKSISNLFTLTTRMITNSEQDVYILIDPLKGMTDYSAMFKYKENIVTALNDPRKIVVVIDKLHHECMARKSAFADVGANNIYSYEKTMRQQNPNFKLARIFVFFEEFHCLTNSEYVKYGFKSDLPGSTAFKLKELMKISRFYGFSFHCSAQRATADEIPATLKPGLTRMMAFRVNNPDDASALKLPHSEDIQPEQRGRCAYEAGFMQFPYLNDEMIVQLLDKYYKPLNAILLSSSVKELQQAVL